MNGRVAGGAAAGLAALVIGAPIVFAADPDTVYDPIRLAAPDAQDGGRYGDRMKSAGDLDGDGVGDFWVAAYSFDVGANPNVGRISAISGKTRAVMYVIDHPEPQACMGFACGLGWTISNLGDVDGDRVNDLAAAAVRQNVTADGDSCTPPAMGSPPNGCNASQGKAYVFSGSPGKPRTPLYELNNPEPQAFANFGWASTAGDIVRADGAPGQDGVSDVMVGAYQNDFPAGCGNPTPVPSGCRKDQGQAFIFNGAATLPAGARPDRFVRTLDVPAEDRYVDPETNTCVSAMPGPTAQECGALGIVNEGVGDVNKDGFDDQSGTAWTTGVDPTTGKACRGLDSEPNCNERQGRIYIYSGRDGTVLRKVDDPVPQEGALFGLQIVQAGAPGDVNGDGFDDIFGNGFGQNGPSRDGGAPIDGEGRAWVISGADGKTVLLDLLDPTPGPSGTYGYALEATDYDLDGKPDLHIGSFDGSYVIDGQDGSLLKAFDLPPGDEAGQQPGNTNLGRSVASPGDLNGDGQPDYLSGSPGHDVTLLNEGRVYLFQSNVPPPPDEGGGGNPPPGGPRPGDPPPGDPGGDDRGPRVRPNLTRPAARAVQAPAGSRSSVARVSQSRSRILVRVRGRMVGNRGRACGGRIRIGTRAGRRRVSTRTARMGRSCRYSARYTIAARRLPKRLRPRGRTLVLRVAARYQGNSLLTGDLSPTRRVKVRR